MYSNHVHIVYGYFDATMLDTKYGTCDRDQVAHKAENIYHLTLGWWG